MFLKFLLPAIFNLTWCLHEIFFSRKITADLSAGSWFTPLFLMLSWWLREPIGWQQATVAWRKENSFQTVYSREFIVWKLFWDETPQRWVVSGFPLETKGGSIVKVTFDADYCLLFYVSFRWSLRIYHMFSCNNYLGSLYVMTPVAWTCCIARNNRLS